MKLLQVSCDQFAGIRDRRLDFAEGVNVVFGPNESGKSTLVNLIEKTLFMSTEIGNKAKQDKDFKADFFPSAKKGGAYSGDSIDGKLTFETDKGRFTLKKEWGPQGGCSLLTPGGLVRDKGTIAKILQENLRYGEGVYSEMLLFPQHSGDKMLADLLNEGADTAGKREIESTVAKAFAAAGGIGMDDIEKAIDSKIDELLDKYWDVAGERPKKKSTAGPYAQSSIKAVHSAYYALEDAKQAREEFIRKQNALDAASARWEAMVETVNKLENAERSFSAVESKLAVLAERKKRTGLLEEELGKHKTAQERWPLAAGQDEKVKALAAEKNRAILSDRLEKARKASEKLAELEKTANSKPCPEPAEIAAARLLERELFNIEKKLSGMNLSAAIRMMGGHSVEVRSLRTGEQLDIAGEKLAITEAVTVSVPGVMEMRLAPANVDAEAAAKELTEKRAELDAVLKKYAARDAADLESIRGEHLAAKTEADRARAQLSQLLGDTALEALEAEAKAAGDAPFRQIALIDSEIRALCGSSDTTKMTARLEAELEKYVDEYGSEDALRSKIAGTEAEIARLNAETESAKDIPEEYLAVGDPERHLEDLRSKLDAAKADRDSALIKKRDAVKELETIKERTGDDPDEAIRKAQALFDEKKAMLTHWLHIRSVFAGLKTSALNAPMADLAASFANYLGLISGGCVEPEFSGQGKLAMEIYSGGSLMDHAKLSDGTRLAVMLAFRLAVLDHLFPSGGGLIVLDDPIADMDQQRAAAACRLICECAKRHQVVFLTCHEELIKALPGNLIRM